MSVIHANQRVIELLKRWRGTVAQTCSLSPEGREELRQLDEAIASMSDPVSVGTVIRYGKSPHGRQWHQANFKEDGSVDLPDGTPLYTVPVISEEDEHKALSVAQRSLIRAEKLLTEIAAGKTPSKATVQSVAQACAFAASFAAREKVKEPKLFADEEPVFEQAGTVSTVDYETLVEAAFTLHGYRQGTPQCVAFKHGAEWQSRQGVAPEPVDTTGFTLAPLLPTPEMAKAGCYRYCSQFIKDYQAMMAVAPKPETAVSPPTQSKLAPPPASAPATAPRETHSLSLRTHAALMEALNWCLAEINGDTPATRNGIRVMALSLGELRDSASAT